MTDEPRAPLLAYATPIGYASGLAGPARLGQLIVAPRLPDGTVDLPPRCVVCNAPADRHWRRSVWYFRRGYLWWLLLSIYGLIGLGITAWISHRTVRLSAGLCGEHWRARRWRTTIGTSAVVVGFAMLFGSMALDVSRSSMHSSAVRDVVVPVAGFTGAILALAGAVYAVPRSMLLKPIWADDEIACLAGAGLPFLDGLPTVGDGAKSAPRANTEPGLPA